jgi:hypothetical protein
MSQSDSLECELEALRELSTKVAEGLDRLSALVPLQKRHLVRLLRAEALGLADSLDEVADVPASARLRRPAA